MDKFRKATIELCAAIELATEGINDDGAYPIEDVEIIDKLVREIKASFNHSMQYHYEQHILRERDFRGLAKIGKEPAA